MTDRRRSCSEEFGQRPACPRGCRRAVCRRPALATTTPFAFKAGRALTNAKPLAPLWLVAAFRAANRVACSAALLPFRSLGASRAGRGRESGRTTHQVGQEQEFSNQGWYPAQPSDSHPFHAHQSRQSASLNCSRTCMAQSSRDSAPCAQPEITSVALAQPTSPMRLQCAQSASRQQHGLLA